MLEGEPLYPGEIGIILPVGVALTDYIAGIDDHVSRRVVTSLP
jgi:hypothetical protein